MNDSTSLFFNPSPPPSVSLSSLYLATANTAFLISNSDTVAVGTLRQDGGTISGNMIVQTLYEWTQGVYTADTTADITIPPGIILTVTGSGEKVLDSLHLNIEGIAVMQDSGLFTLVDSAVVNIAPGGTLYVGPALTMIGVGTFYNSGETDFDPQLDTILIDVPVINSTIARTPGTIDVLTRPVVWGAGGYNGATITIFDQGQLIIDGSFVNAGLIDVQAGGELSLQGQMMMTGNSTITGSGVFNNDGTIQSQGGVVSTLTNIPIEPELLNNDSGSLTVQSDTLTLLQGGVNRGVITILAGSVLKVFGNFVNDSAGLIQGGGVLDVSAATFTNFGTISPGMSPGALSIYGNMVMGPSSVLQLELNGASTLQYDRLNVSGLLQLNGTLVLSVADGYIPQESDSLQLMNCGAWDGSFQQISGNVLSNGTFLNLNFGPGGMLLSVIPGLEAVVRALSPGSQSIQLSWNSIPMATSYSVYSAAAAGGPFTLYQTITIPDTSLTIVRNVGEFKRFYRVTVTVP